MLTPVLHYSVKGDMIVAVTGLSTHVFFKLKVGQVILVDFHYEFVYGIWFVFLGHVLIIA
jgi:hypothetical protein